MSVEKAPIENYEEPTLVTDSNYESLGLTSEDVGNLTLKNSLSIGEISIPDGCNVMTDASITPCLFSLV